MTPAVTIAKMTDLLEKDLKDIKELIGSYDQRLRVIEVNTTKISSELYMTTSHLEKVVGEQEKKIEDVSMGLSGLKEKLESTRSLLNWVLGIVSAITIGIVVELLKRGIP